MAAPKKIDGPLSEKQFAQLFEAQIRVHRNGCFTAAPPRIEGLYATWSRDGGFRGYVEVLFEGAKPLYAFRGRVSADPTRIHVGWWWSRPLPPLPAAPSWDEET